MFTIDSFRFWFSKYFSIDFTFFLFSVDVEVLDPLDLFDLFFSGFCFWDGGSNLTYLILEGWLLVEADGVADGGPVGGCEGRDGGDESNEGGGGCILAVDVDCKGSGAVGEEEDCWGLVMLLDILCDLLGEVPMGGCGGQGGGGSDKGGGECDLLVGEGEEGDLRVSWFVIGKMEAVMVESDDGC